MPVDLGAIIRLRGETYLATHRTTGVQRKAMTAIAACRTAALGGQRQQCDRCGYEHIQWHSCRNRACPRCQFVARQEWLAARSSELLPVPYFHVVFTVPDDLNVLALHAPRVFYDRLFKAAGAALTEIAQSRLHVDIGSLCVLHTWGQTLVLHPHVHCVVPGGGFSSDRTHWRTVRKPTFFLPVKVLSRRFRTLLCSSLLDASRSGVLKLPPAIALTTIVARARVRDWVVYAKAPFGGPAQVLAYLANYTHRIAISNARLVSFNTDKVTFRYRDYRSDEQKMMTLDVDEFLRRFLMHVVPTRFVRIRYYGFMANRTRAKALVRARQLIGDRISPPPARQEPQDPRCARCGEGIMRSIAFIEPAAAPRYDDTS